MRRPSLSAKRPETNAGSHPVTIHVHENSSDRGIGGVRVEAARVAGCVEAPRELVRRGQRCHDDAHGQAVGFEPGKTPTLHGIFGVTQQRPAMRFVPVKDAEQQSVLMLHRARSLLVRQRTMLVNALPAHLAEFGIIAPQGLRHVEILTKAISHEQKRLPELARSILQTIVDQLDGTMARVREIEGRLAKWHRHSRVSRLSATVPGVGIIGASAIAATVADPSLFRSGREFAAWLGMTPRQNSSGGKERLGRTSKCRDKYSRSLLTAGAVAVLRHASSTNPRRRVGPRSAGAQTDQSCRGRAGQQDRPYRLGGDGCAARVTRRRTFSGNQHRRRQPTPHARVKRNVMARGRAADREDPNNSRRKAARSLDRDPISERHQGQRSWAPHHRAEHMTAPDHLAKTELNLLPRRERPHMICARYSEAHQCRVISRWSKNRRVSVEELASAAGSRPT